MRMAQKAAKLRQIAKLLAFRHTPFLVSHVYPATMPDRTRTFTLFLLALFPLTGAQITDALKIEMTRSMEHFKKQLTPPYFLSYELIENKSMNVSGSFGALVSSSPVNRRQLGIDLRVGSYQPDNTHPIRGAMGNMFDNFSFFQMPIEDDPGALRAMLWYYNDQKYKRAVEQFISVRTNVKLKAEETDKSPPKAEMYDEPNPAALAGNRSQWEEGSVSTLLRLFSATETFTR